MVVRDLRDEVITPRTAAEVYGVAMAADGRTADPAATKRQRDALRRRRAATMQPALAEPAA
jgi:hypothetical protein